MANIKIAQLTNQTTLSDSDIVIVETATSTNKMTVGNFKELILASHLAGVETYQATLQNGWTGSLTYSKNGLGQVTIEGQITIGLTAVSTVIAQLPTDYGPLNSRVVIPSLQQETGFTANYLWIDIFGSRRGQIRIAYSSAELITGNTLHFNMTFSSN